MTQKGWIGVDMDGTLVKYDERRGTDVIGDMLAPMLARVRAWLNEGIEVRLLTARATDPTLASFIKPWLREHNLPDLAVTNRKDRDLLQIWDDRGVRVETNTGNVLTPRQFLLLVPGGWIGVELDGTLAMSASPQSWSHIGEPVPAMLNRVRQWQMVGIDVRIFTARADDPAQQAMIGEWLAQQGLQPLPITSKKDFQMAQFYDDRCVHVVHNTGEASLLPDEQLVPRYAG